MHAHINHLFNCLNEKHNQDYLFFKEQWKHLNFNNILYWKIKPDWNIIQHYYRIVYCYLNQSNYSKTKM